MTEREAQTLRDEFAGLAREIRAAYRQGYADGIDDERAAVVAWLRVQARAQGASPDERTILTWASNHIDRGEHRREEEP